MIKRAAVLLLATCLTACGGGGGGGSNASIPPPSTTPPSNPGTPVIGFETGTFEPSENFAQRCENPRTGFDSRGRPFPDTPGTTLDENNWLRSWSNELYLWYDEIVDVDPASLDTPEYFEQMRTFARTASGAEKDRFHFTIPTDEWLNQTEQGVVGGYGVTFTVLRSTPPREIVVAYTEPGTPATAAGIDLRRGAMILEVDGVDVGHGTQVDVLNAGLFPGDNETHSFLIQDQDSPTPRTITMTSGQFVSTPVQNVQVMETERGLVGYFTFNDHNSPAEQLLIDAITELRDANIADLVLDLRYNGGGFLAIANELAYMIAGDTAVGQTFELLEFNDKHQLFDPVTGRRLAPDTFLTTSQGFSTPSGEPLPSLGLSRVFVLTGPGTCSASESIINGLRGIDVEVIQIGETSCGKPYGFYPFDNCGTTYFSTQFRGVNQKGFGDYTDGFSPASSGGTGATLPGCLVSDDFTHALGDENEGRLRAALQYRIDEQCPTVIGASDERVVAARQRLGNVDGETIKSAWSSNRILNTIRGANGIP